MRSGKCGEVEAMKSTEQSPIVIRMREELERLDDTALLDRRIAQEGSPRIEELSLFESGMLEAALIQRFGVDYREAVEKRRKSRAA